MKAERPPPARDHRPARDRRAARRRGPQRRRADILKQALAAGRAEIARRLAERPYAGHRGGRGLCLPDRPDPAPRLRFRHPPAPSARQCRPPRSGCCCSAVGGYGRGEMALHSDVDIAFVTPWKPTAWTESAIEAILYLLWDLGLKVGHSHAQRRRGDPRRRAPTIRSAPRCSKRATSGATRRSTTRSRRASGRRSSPASVAGFVKEKLDEREARHKRMGDSRYVVEPNVKEGKGGLRDLHALFWIGKYAYRLRDVDELVEVGLLSAEELRQFHRAERFLWAVRCHLHLVAGRAEERLTFDYQREIAARMHYADRPGKSRGRALHAPLFPAREDGRRPDRRVPRPSRREVRAARAPLRPAAPSAAARASSKASCSTAAGSPSPTTISSPKDPVRLIEMFALADRTASKSTRWRCAPPAATPS